VGFKGGPGGKESGNGLGEGRGRFRKNPPDTTATEEADTEPFACRPFFPLAGGAAASA